MKYALTPILVILVANVIYNLATKETPAGVNMVASLSVTYAIAAVVTFVIYAMTDGPAGFVEEIHKMNWATVALGITIIGLELGYLMAYRAGWPINIASLVANISLAVVLMLVGTFFYHEALTLKHIVGALLCIGGLGLMVL